MENKQICEMTDLELAEVQGQQYQLLMQVQNNLLAVNNEIVKRKAKD